jgi:hypothetical protein
VKPQALDHSEAIANWTTDELSGGPGVSPTYTDLPIETMATVRSIDGLANDAEIRKV